MIISEFLRAKDKDAQKDNVLKMVQGITSNDKLKRELEARLQPGAKDPLDHMKSQVE